MSELWQLGAPDSAVLVEHGDTTDRAVIKAHLARITAVNPHLNAAKRHLDNEMLRAVEMTTPIPPVRA